jgi:hypothetical protein
MMMNTDPETFERLQRLLALKRYEQPPPGYFDRFRREVIGRIREIEGAPNLVIFQPPVPWLRRLWQAVEARALFPAALGAAVCGTLVLGLLRSSAAPASAMPIAELLEGTVYAAPSHPIKLPLTEPAVPEPSSTGVLADQPAAGILGELHAVRNPGAGRLPPASPALAN